MNRRGLALISSLFGIFCSGVTSVPTFAATEIVPLERLHVHDVIYLPTVRSQYQATFTKPKTWQLSPSSNLYVEFQHSHELLPNRSWLQIIMNDKVIKHIPLTAENAPGSKLTLPLPVGMLKDFNTLTFRVEQHYTDKCEDPLDKSLWTQVLPTTKLNFEYTPIVPTVNLTQYPYPIIDNLTYSPASVHFVTAQHASVSELQAIALVNTHLAQQAQTHELRSRLTFGNPNSPENEHLAFVGKPATIPEILKFANSFGDYAIQNGRWVNRKNGQALSEDQGIILFFQSPGATAQTILIVSGNSDQAVLKAAQALTTRPHITTLAGNVSVLPQGWSPSTSQSAKVPRFIENQTRTFRELGFDIQEVHKINAPPITYHVPIVGDFKRSAGKLWLDLNLSYSPQLNPEYSSLELRMNDRSIANIPLTNPEGEQNKQVSIPISNELINVRNDLVAQFHLMPDKYGWCVDNYVDNAWGKIMDDSKFRVEGSVNAQLPDLGLLNSTMYPYSKADNLQDLQIVLPKNPSAALLDTMLAFTTRLGRATFADTDLRFGLSQEDSSLPNDKHLAVFRLASDGTALPDGARLTWKANGANLLKLFNLPESSRKISSDLFELGQGANLEQYFQNNRVISVFTANNAGGFEVMASLLNQDKLFEKISQGFIQQFSQLNPDVNAVNDIHYHLEQRAGSTSWWETIWNWLKALPQKLPAPWGNLVLGFIVAFFTFIFLRLIFGRNRR